ncbi:orf66 [Alcelaphine gammaherpesvirus 2]|uniref:Orf66 n=1 Tax=Alcelaphine gammaherpesvirus 2 TaxID=138184 RepID=A0A068ABT9_9GAMA|nr:orf66 [Alcelaphine gammaherpesvirus 2]AIA62103.1 orf66 [Alcelaphine gammaherpesvirus 2]
MGCHVCLAFDVLSRWANSDPSGEVDEVAAERFLWRLYLQILNVLEIDHSSFVNFVFFGKRLKYLPWGEHGDPFTGWLQGLLEKCTCPCTEIHKQLFYHGLYMCYFLAVYLFLYPYPVILKYTKSFFRGEQLWHLLCKFEWVIEKFMEYVFKIKFSHPVMKINESALEYYLFLRKKLKRQYLTPQLAVPPLFTRLPPHLQFLDGVRGQLEPHCEALAFSLKSCCQDVPCGSPFESMVKNLALRCTLSHKFAVIPVSEQSPNIVMQIREKILSVSVLSCVVRVPVLSATVWKLIENKKKHTFFIYCGECKHCLNFGKGKFLKINFNPTHAFYCRDQKEKQCNVCATTGRIYCSFCGSPSIRTGRLTQMLDGVPIIRAVMANNAAFMLNYAYRSVDFILPCLGTSAKCEGSILRRLSLLKLLYLTLNVRELMCVKCQS